MTFAGTWHITEMENWKEADPEEPIGDVNIVKDFLPPPEQLVPKKNTVQVTIEFTNESDEILE
ncbi:MAG: hypothetical protein F6K21_28525 [Symploca sp. SIO2D2]|nr:hypothetical protein [Symploca sp. SIO2D2]